MRRLVRAIWLLSLLALVVGGCTSAAPSGRKAAGAPDRLPEGILTVEPNSVSRTVEAPTRGVMAPEFAFVAADGAEYHLRDLKGHPLVLNFWATWCPPCRAEMPALDAAYLKYRDRGLLILAINQMDDRERVEQFRQTMGLHMPMLLDTQGKVGHAYLVRGLPTSFFVAADGTVVLRWTGMLTEQVLQKGLESILAPGERGES